MTNQTRSQVLRPLLCLATAAFLVASVLPVLPSALRINSLLIFLGLLAAVLRSTAPAKQQPLNINYRVVDGLPLKDDPQLKWYERWANAYIERFPSKRRYTYLALLLLPTAAALAVLGTNAILYLLVAPVLFFTGVYCASRSHWWDKL